MFGPFKKNDKNNEEEVTMEEVEQNESVNDGTEEERTGSSRAQASHKSYAGQAAQDDMNDSQESAEDNAETVDSVESDLCEQELAQVKDTLVRLGADFQNYKKRVEKDRSHWAHMIQSEMILDLLPVIDNFDRALEEAQKEESAEDAKWLEGINMIHKAFYDYLKKQDVAVIEQMQTFDPELHEALMQVESEGHQEGDIVQVLQRGFTLKGKVIRPAKVSVCK